MSRDEISKPWPEMTPAERLADRIARNREIDKRVSQRVVPEKKSAGAAATAVASRQKAVRNALDKFQQIKVTQGVDAAAEFVRSRKA
ncbi:MAG: hypothetical protein ABSG41_18605 [Bryobacteraceae bacterium]|jgi:hypothetical protein